MDLVPTNSPSRDRSYCDHTVELCCRLVRFVRVRVYALRDGSESGLSLLVDLASVSFGTHSLPLKRSELQLYPDIRLNHSVLKSQSPDNCGIQVFKKHHPPNGQVKS